MFTGLIEEIGRLDHVRQSHNGALVKISAQKILKGLRLGDSIAVDGVCLTVTKFDAGGFEADIMPTTYENTRISHLTSGSELHLERALRVGDRLGGHFVSGHVDGQASVLSLTEEGDAYRLRISRDQSFYTYVVLKGSVAINGVSLTIDKIRDKWLEVSLVKHTQGETILTKLKPGDRVNVESDMLLKFVHGLLGPSAGDKGSFTDSGFSSGHDISMEELKRAGFL